jgi:hypothetical protein
VLASALALGGLAAPAYADPNPHMNSCQTAESTPGGGTPGNAATSPGSVFNEPAFNSTSGGKAGQAYNAARAGNKVGAVAQYDTACANTLRPALAPRAPIGASTDTNQQRAGHEGGCRGDVAHRERPLTTANK